MENESEKIFAAMLVMVQATLQEKSPVLFQVLTRGIDQDTQKILEQVFKVMFEVKSPEEEIRTRLFNIMNQIRIRTPKKEESPMMVVANATPNRPKPRLAL